MDKLGFCNVNQKTLYLWIFERQRLCRKYLQCLIFKQILKYLFLLHTGSYKDPDRSIVCSNDSVSKCTDLQGLVRKSQKCPMSQPLASTITMELNLHSQINASIPSCVVQICRLSSAALIWNVLAWIRMNCLQCLLIMQARSLLRASHVMFSLTCFKYWW